MTNLTAIQELEEMILDIEGDVTIRIEVKNLANWMRIAMTSVGEYEASTFVAQLKEMIG